MINLIDRFLSVVYTITRKDLQLVGLTAMLVAAKYEEIWAPKVVNIDKEGKSVVKLKFILTCFQLKTSFLCP
jgi:hypothetical protein